MGEYDILILSAKESQGLETWLTENGYRDSAGRLAGARRLPQAGDAVLRRQGEPRASSRSSASPTCGRSRWPTRAPSSCSRSASAWSTPPARRSCSSMRSPARGGSRPPTTAPSACPSDAEVPLFVKDEFGPFYKAMFGQQVRKQDMRTRLPRVRLGHGLVRSLRGRSALRGRAAAARRLLDRAGRTPPDPGPRTSSSPGSTCATTPRTSPRTSSSRRPPTARTSRGASSCATPGRAAARCEAAQTLPPRAAEALREAGRDPRLAHRLGRRQDPQQDEPSRRAPAERRRTSPGGNRSGRIERPDVSISVHGPRSRPASSPFTAGPSRTPPSVANRLP